MQHGVHVDAREDRGQIGLSPGAGRPDPEPARQPADVLGVLDGQAAAAARDDDLPPALAGRRYYRPTARGYEKEVARRLDAWRALKRAKGRPAPARTEEK